MTDGRRYHHHHAPSGESLYHAFWNDEDGALMSARMERCACGARREVVERTSATVGGVALVTTETSGAWAFVP